MATIPESKPGTPPCLPKGFSPGDILEVSPVEGWVGIHTDDLKRWQDSIQHAFDLGHKASGGSIVPDAMRGCTWDLVEIALDRNEVDAVGAAAERAATERWDPRTHRALVSFLDKISFFRRKP
jgi:hypothetical protein